MAEIDTAPGGHPGPSVRGNVAADRDFVGRDATAVGHSVGELNVSIMERQQSYIEAIWASEQRAATVRNWMIISQIGTFIALIALVIVLYVVGVNFAGHVNQQFDAVNERFDALERRLNAVDNRIQRIATPEPFYYQGAP